MIMFDNQILFCVIRKILIVLLMKNIFIQLKAKTNLKQEALLKILEVKEEEEKPLPAFINQYFEQEEDHTQSSTIHFIIQLIPEFSQPEVKEKLFALLVFFVSKQPVQEALSIAVKVESMKESIFNRVRFFSLLFKSTNDNQLKKRLITQSIMLIGKESKISMFSNFVQNFSKLISNLTFNNNEYVELYLQLINYLQKHVVYKKLWKGYIVECLLNVAPQHVNTPEVDSLFAKLVNSSEVTEETIPLSNSTVLNKNKYYPYLEALLLGDFERYAQLPKENLAQLAIRHNQLERNIKIQAIPRILTGNRVTTVSYEQIALLLKINKTEVESYVIQAVQQGILKAKIDESSETIIVNSVRFMALRAEQRATLQKGISNLASKLQTIASR